MAQFFPYQECNYSRSVEHYHTCGLTLFLSELMEQAGLAHAHVTCTEKQHGQNKVPERQEILPSRNWNGSMKTCSYWICKHRNTIVQTIHTCTISTQHTADY